MPVDFLYMKSVHNQKRYRLDTSGRSYWVDTSGRSYWIDTSLSSSLLASLSYMKSVKL